MTKKKAPPPENTSRFAGDDSTMNKDKKPAPGGLELPFSAAAKKRNRPNLVVRSALFTARNWKKMILAGLLGFTVLGYMASEHNKELNKKSVDLQEVVDLAIQENAEEALERYERAGQYYNKVTNPTGGVYNTAFALDGDVEDFCKDVEEDIRNRYVGKNGIADFTCTKDKMTITMEDGSVLRANALGSVYDGPSADKSGDLAATVHSALVKHTEADDEYYNSFGTDVISSFWKTNDEKDEICQKILDEVNATFAGKVQMTCKTKRTIDFLAPETGQAVRATPDMGIQVQPYKIKPRS